MASVGSGKQIAKYALAADITNSATTLTVGSSPLEGTAIDDDTLPVVAVLDDSSTAAASATGAMEQVLVTAVSSTTWTVVRAYNSTTGVAHLKDASVQVVDTDAAQAKRAGAGDNIWLPLYVSGAQSTGAKAGPQAVIPADCLLRSVTVFLNTANAGSTFIVDFQKNGTDLPFEVTIADGATVATKLLATADVALTALDRIKVDVEQVGSGTAGSDLSIMLELERV